MIVSSSVWSIDIAVIFGTLLKILQACMFDFWYEVYCFQEIYESAASVGFWIS